MAPKEHWDSKPDQHDYPAAANYLSLLLPEAEVNKVVAKMKDAPLGRWKAKDLLRASRLALLPTDNPHVSVDLKRVEQGPEAVSGASRTRAYDQVHRPHDRRRVPPDLRQLPPRRGRGHSVPDGRSPDRVRFSAPAGRAVR